MKDQKFMFRADARTLELLRLLAERADSAKSDIIRRLIRQAAEEQGLLSRPGAVVGSEQASN